MEIALRSAARGAVQRILQQTREGRGNQASSEQKEVGHVRLSLKGRRERKEEAGEEEEARVEKKKRKTEQPAYYDDDYDDNDSFIDEYALNCCLTRKR